MSKTFTRWEKVRIVGAVVGLVGLMYVVGQPATPTASASVEELVAQATIDRPEPENVWRRDMTTAVLNACTDFINRSAAHAASVDFAFMNRQWSYNEAQDSAMLLWEFTAANSFGVRDRYTAFCLVDSGDWTLDIIPASLDQTLKLARNR